MDSKDGSRAQEDAAVAAPTNAGLPSRPEGEPAPLSVSDLASMSHLSAMSSLSPMMESFNQRGGGRGRGGRGRAGYRSNYRGTGIQTQGGYHATSSSSYGFSQPRQHYSGRTTSQDARQDNQQAYAPQQQPQMGRGGGRGGYSLGQQTSGRKPPRTGGRSRGTASSRTRNYPPRPPLEQPAQDLFNRATTIDAAAAAAEAQAGWDTQVEIAATVSQQHAENSSAQTPVPHPVVLPSIADTTSIETTAASDEAIQHRRESETSESDTSLALVKVDRTPSLDSDTTEDTDATIQSIPEPYDELVTATTATTNSTATPSTPTHPIHLQDIHFASVPNPVHPAPGQPPETICAWYTYPMPPRQGVFMAPLPGLSPVRSGPPPPPPPHHPMAPPSHFYFTHDHAYLALCHPVPMLPYAWLPIPYLAYWGPERFGKHPNYYDVPAFASDA